MKFCLQDYIYKNILIDINTGCWNWQSTLNEKGYGLAFRFGKKYRAHRLSYESFCGIILDKLLVCHSCDNRKCVNPSHLFLGTNQDNYDDAKLKGRHKPYSKLSKQQVIDILKRLAEGKSKRSIAKSYNVYPSTIARIFYKKTWKHIS